MFSNLKRYTNYLVNLADILSMVLSYLLAFVIRSNMQRIIFVPQDENDYVRFLMIVIIGYIIFNILSLYNDDQFLKRSTREEFTASAKMVFYVLVTVIVYMYLAKSSELLSRIFVGLFSIILLLVDFLLRTAVKEWIIPHMQKSGRAEHVLIIASSSQVEKLIEKIENTNDWRFLISGIVITDKDMKDEKIGEYSVISDVGNMFTDIESMDIDSVLIAQDQEPDEKIVSWMKEFRRLGKIIHMQIDEFEVGYSYKGLDRIGFLPVMSYHDIAPMPKRQVLLRRIFSIIMALLGLPLLFVVSVITWIFDKIESPGKLFVTRVRVGVNNRRYYQYRFRYYRMDAQERIQEGKSPYTFIGKILRKTHLDGLPMLVNIISGDMDLIGPKAPSLPRYLGMSAEERNQLSIRPGAIGYWSSDRKKDKIAQAQEEYVLNWNIGKDIVIIVITALRYISGRSLRRDGETHIQEELDFIRDLNEEYQPYPYDHSLYHKEATGSYAFYLVIKRIFDIIISILAIIVASPLLLILTILVIADDGGSPLYGHRRIGMNGKMITIYKFRSMMEDAGDLRKLLSAEQLEQYKTEFKVDNDPRITSIGNFIRKTSLDELPQLFNILEGSMSLVGPRPIVDEEALIYGDQIGKFLSVKPGLTGYWQAYARNNATYESGERQKMEMYYVDNCSLWLDIRILFRTVGAVLKREGAQ